LKRGFQTDRFAAEWDANIIINRPGEYRFYTRSDDGSRLYVDNSKVVENWGLHGRRERSDVK